MKSLRKLVLLAAGALFVSWTILFFLRSTTEDPDWVIRFVLGLIMAVLILLRRKSTSGDENDAGLSKGVAILGIGATGLILVGIIVPVRQFEWLGLILLLYACLRWSLPKTFSKDIILAFFLLYWIHPLPTVLFGKFQLTMQWLSVQGAERLLHVANQRVWADGLVLMTGLREFGVPESCSGMRTAVTVILCVLGVGVLFRLKWCDILGFLLVGTVQVLVLNIVRIFSMVYMSDRMPPRWAQTFLHDSLWLFLLVGIALVQVEMVAWKRFRENRQKTKEAIASGEIEPPEKASFLPAFWTILVRYGWIFVTVSGLLLVTGYGVYRSRPAHESAMISGVIDGLLRTNPGAAERAAIEALCLTPQNRVLRRKKIQALVLRAKYEQALKEIKVLSRPLTTFEEVLKSWACMGLGRTEEGYAIINRLPEETQKIPGIAIFRAEYAARDDQIVEAARNAEYAAKSHMMIGRVRALFPYLASREQWLAISRCDSPVPFDKFPHALIAIQAGMRVNQLTGTTRVLRAALAKWPDEPRLLSSLAEMAIRRPSEDWEGLFDKRLKAHLDSLDQDRLATYVNFSFRLCRPDLAWLAYLKLAELDPQDPALFFAPAQYAAGWFTFRKHQLGMKSQNPMETVDMRAVYGEKRNDPAFKPFWKRVPLAEEIVDSSLDRVRAKYLKLCLKELEAREKSGKLTKRMEMTFPVALSMAGNHGETHLRLDALAKKYPGERADILLQHALTYDRRAQWQESYEVLREYHAVVGYPALTSRLLLINALINMNQGFYAMDVVQATCEQFPDAVLANVAMAAAWDIFGFKEEALFELNRTGARTKSRTYIQLLYETGRFLEAERMSLALGIKIRKHVDVREYGRVVAAEAAITPQWPDPLSPKEMRAAADKARRKSEMAASPFIRSLSILAADWYENGGKGQISDPGLWIAVGRDDRERAAALHRLATLLARQKDLDGARNALDKAVELVPGSTVLHRVRIAVTRGDADTVASAMKTNASDPDVWLASLVVKLRDVKPPIKEDLRLWAVGLSKRAVASQLYSPGTMIRASDLFLRKGIPEAAEMLARDAIARSQGLVAAYVMGLRCAVARKDLAWARSCALGGVDNAQDPKPFHQMIVNLGFAQKMMDRDLITALEFLKENFPKESEWKERLGFVYFQNGDVNRALSVLGPIIRNDIKGVRMESLLLAAEAARQQGEMKESLDILETAYAMYPDAIGVMNNLVYGLAQDPRTLLRAKSLLPELLKKGGRYGEVWDTAATVYLKSGRIPEAEKHINEAIKRLDDDAYSALEIRLNHAEILLAGGAKDDALKAAGNVLKNKKCTRIVEMAARKLIDRIHTSMLEDDLRTARDLLKEKKVERAEALLKGILKSPHCGGEVERDARRLLKEKDERVRLKAET